MQTPPIDAAERLRRMEGEMKTKPLSPTIRKYLEFIRDAGRPVGFTEIIKACSPGRNWFRRLKECGYIIDLTVYYTGKNGEEYTGLRFAQYVLSDAGRAALGEKEEASR